MDNDEQMANEFQEDTQEIPVEETGMPQEQPTEMPAVPQPKLVPEADLHNLQSVKDREITEMRRVFEAQQATLNEQLYLERQARERFEQEKYNGLDPDEKKDFQMEKLTQGYQQLQRQLEEQRKEGELQQARNWAVSEGLPMELASKALRTADIPQMLIQHYKRTAEEAVKERDEVKQKREIEARKESNLDVVIPSGGLPVNTADYSSEDWFKAGLAELKNKRR